MRKILLTIGMIVTCGMMLLSPVMSGGVVMAEDDNCVPANIFKDEQYRCEKGDGSGIKNLLKYAVNVLTIGVGILAAIGIAVSGVQYLTAGGNEEQTRKAKRRLFEIVIGVVAYGLIYAALFWLLPGFNGTNV